MFSPPILPTVSLPVAGPFARHRPAGLADSHICVKSVSPARVDRRVSRCIQSILTLLLRLGQQLVSDDPERGSPITSRALWLSATATDLACVAFDFPPAIHSPHSSIRIKSVSYSLCNLSYIFPVPCVTLQYERLFEQSP